MRRTSLCAPAKEKSPKTLDIKGFPGFFHARIFLTIISKIPLNIVEFRVLGAPEVPLKVPLKQRISFKAAFFDYLL